MQFASLHFVGCRWPAAAAHIILGSALSAILLIGCDQAPGPDAAGGEPPALSQFEFDPHTVSVSDPIVDQDGETLRFPLRVSVTAIDQDDDLERVAYVIQSPYDGSQAVAEGTLESVGGSTFTREINVSIRTGEIGVYSILVYAVDRSGSLSDDVRGMLTIGGTGGPPVLLDVSVPDTVRRPAPGEPATLLRMTATVSDPDGIANINEVSFWNVSNPNVRFPMQDDGRFDESGDDTEGDGIYSAVVRIESTNQPVPNTFAFQASDRSGLESNVIEQTVVVE